MLLDEDEWSGQCADTVLMVRPCAFGFNEDTAASNVMQNRLELAQSLIQKQAVEEFDGMVKYLRERGVQVIVVQDTHLNPATPDSIFPNNWFVTFPGTKVKNGGSIDITSFPMCGVNRRLERNSDVLATLGERYNIGNITRLEHYEDESKFLEGTGSMIIDRVHAFVYACRSPRTDEEVLNEFCKQHEYTPILFDARDCNGKPMYHTNVIMALGRGFAILCEEMIKDVDELKKVRETLEKNHCEIIPITEYQVNKFAGNALGVMSTRNSEPLIVMSQVGYESLTDEQRSAIQRYGQVLTPSIPTIETIGGGSCRCMLAEIFSS